MQSMFSTSKSVMARCPECAAGRTAVPSRRTGWLRFVATISGISDNLDETKGNER